MKQVVVLQAEEIASLSLPEYSVFCNCALRKSWSCVEDTMTTESLGPLLNASIPEVLRLVLS